MEFLILFCSVPDKETGEKISRVLLENRLAACVSSLSQFHSLYWWRENIESDKEFLLMIKTRKELFHELEKMIQNLHPYDVPEIIGLPVVHGSESYLNWIKSETRG